MCVRVFEELVLTLNQSRLTSLNFQKRLSSLERRGVYTWFYQCCGQQEKIADKTQKITLLRSCIIIVSFGSNLSDRSMHILKI